MRRGRKCPEALKEVHMKGGSGQQADEVDNMQLKDSGSTSRAGPSF